MTRHQKKKRKSGSVLAQKPAQNLQTASTMAKTPTEDMQRITGTAETQTLAEQTVSTEESAQQSVQDAKHVWKIKQEKLRRILQEVYSTSENSDEKACMICGELDWQLCQTDSGLLMCRSCMESEVTSMREAAELLYTTYGNFTRLFRKVTFRYPDLELSERSMYDIKLIEPHGKDISGLVSVADDRDSWMSLCVARDIPHSLLEELYVRIFSDQMLRGGKISSLDDPRLQFNDGSEIVKYYLKKAGRIRQAELIQSDS